MSVVCEACGTSNRAMAMFCIGCAGRLPAFVATGPSALASMGVVRPATPPAALNPAPRRAPGRTAAPGGIAYVVETPAFWLVLGVAGVAVLAAFVGWNAQVSDFSDAEDTDKAKSLSSMPPAREWLDKAGAIVQNISSHVGGAPAPAPLTPLVPAALERNDIGPDAPARIVAAYYGALAAGDGHAAEAVITPAKRGVGRFSEARMTQFYGSFSEPLAVRSIRQIDAHAVEARYTYRDARRVCEGTALVRTERIADRTVIRSIRANC